MLTVFVFKDWEILKTLDGEGGFYPSQQGIFRDHLFSIILDDWN
jgi:hypothetical protein